MSPLNIALSPFRPIVALNSFSSAHWSKWKPLLVSVRSHVALTPAVASLFAMWGYISSACSDNFVLKAVSNRVLSSSHKIVQPLMLALAFSFCYVRVHQLSLK